MPSADVPARADEARKRIPMKMVKIVRNYSIKREMSKWRWDVG